MSTAEYYIKIPDKSQMNEETRKLVKQAVWWFNKISIWELYKTKVGINHEMKQDDDGHRWVSIARTDGQGSSCGIPIDWLVVVVPTCSKCNKPMALTQ